MQSQTNVEVTKEEDWNTLLRMEEEYIENICAQIVAFHPDIVITEKGVSDLAQHYLMKADITVMAAPAQNNYTSCVSISFRGHFEHRRVYESLSHYNCCGGTLTL